MNSWQKIERRNYSKWKKMFKWNVHTIFHKSSVTNESALVTGEHLILFQWQQHFRSSFLSFSPVQIEENQNGDDDDDDDDSYSMISIITNISTTTTTKTNKMNTKWQRMRVNLETLLRECMQNILTDDKFWKHISNVNIKGWRSMKKKNHIYINSYECCFFYLVYSNR